MNKIKSLLILGAGNAQLDLIRYCKEKGIETYGCSYSDQDVGIPLLDHFKKINIIDAEKICTYFMENEIEQIYTVGSDISIPTLSYVIKTCGLNSIFTCDSAELCCNKAKAREVLRGSSYDVPYVLVQSSVEMMEKIQDGKISFPFMMKPVDSQGQRGVKLIHTKEEMLEQFPVSISYSREGKVILEKYLRGQEISVNAYVKNGQLKFCMISDRESYEDYPGGIIKAHHFPSVFEGKAAENNIKEFVDYFLEKIGYTDGPMYFQIMVCEEKPYLIECSPRLDGCHLWRIIEKVCGVNLLEAIMADLSGDEDRFLQSITPSHKQKQPMSLRFICQPPNTEYHRDRFDDSGAKEVLYEQEYYAEGDMVKPVNRFMEKCGYQIYIPQKIEE